MRVLCVEDEAGLREDIAEFLRMKAYQVDEAGSGMEAMLQLRKQHYDLVLCDIKMPNMDGYQLLREMRSKDTLMNTPFLFLTALTERDDVVKAHDIGCDAYLTKPIDFSVLDATVRSHIERQQLRDIINASTIQVAQRHMMAAIDDALTGPIAEAGVSIQQLRESAHVLPPAELDRQLIALQATINTHILDLHQFNYALELQSAIPEPRHDAVLAEDLIQLAMAECVYHCPSMPVRYKAMASHGVMIHGDRRMLQRMLAGLIAEIPGTHETKDIIAYAADRNEAILTLADDPAMLHDDDYMLIDATTNLVQLSEVTRQRVVALAYAVQVARAHQGQFSIMLWPDNKLAVRLALPQVKKQ